MRILFLGDIFARSGRDAVKKHLPHLKDLHKPDFIIANCENAAHGFGILPAMAYELLDLGINALTGGNHSLDKKEILKALNENDKILVPENISSSIIGKGFKVFNIAQYKILVVNLLGRVFMEQFIECPFKIMQQILKQYTIGVNVNAIFVDLHCETTSEKIAFARYFDGKISAVIGTHTHVPTSDARILKNGTAFQSDAGMCGDYDSVIGVKQEAIFASFLKQYPKPSKEPATGEAAVCGSVVDLDSKNGLAIAIKSFIIGKL